MAARCFAGRSKREIQNNKTTKGILTRPTTIGHDWYRVARVALCGSRRGTIYRAQQLQISIEISVNTLLVFCVHRPSPWILHDVSNSFDVFLIIPQNSFEIVPLPERRRYHAARSHETAALKVRTMAANDMPEGLPN